METEETRMTETRKQERYGPPLPTADEAAAAGRRGHNIRCNRCGGYGAQWISGARKGWGALALCHPHASAYQDMTRRHAEELARFTIINFEQERK